MTDRDQGFSRRWLGALLHVHDSPERTAAAFALGVFFGFSPFLGLHTVLGIGFAFALNLNRIAVLLGVYSNLPWIIAAYYATATMLGSVITGTRPPPEFQQRLGDLFELSVTGARFWHELASLLRPFIWPFTIGSLIGAALLAGLLYPVALAFLRLRRHSAHSQVSK